MTTAWPDTTFLGRLGPAARDAVVSAGREVRFAAREPILRQGDPDEHVLLLLGGFVKVTAVAENGHEAVLGIRVGGDLIGEMAAIDRQPRSASVIACGPVPARAIAHPEWEHLGRRHPEIHQLVLRSLSEQLRWANRRRLDFGGFAARTRIARVVVELAERHGRPEAGGLVLDLDLTQSELAALAGVSLNSVEKALAHFGRQQLVAAGQRQLTVIDPDGLRAACELSRI